MEDDVSFDAGKIRITSAAPTACASCCGQYPERLHVDFGAAWDGPVMYGSEGSTQQTVDELILCDECLRAGAALLGLATPGDLNARIDDLNAHATELAEKLAGALVVIKKMEETAAARETLEARMAPKTRAKAAAK